MHTTVAEKDREVDKLSITSVLQVEHGLLRAMMEKMGDWLVENLPPDTLRERAAMLQAALDDHARREEEQLFVPLRSRSETARHLIEMMEIVHDEVRGLYEEIKTEHDPKSKLWTILEMSAAHFDREEQELFPLAEVLMRPGELQAYSHTEPFSV